MRRFIQAKDGNGHTISMTLSDGDAAVLELFRNRRSGDTSLSISAVRVDGDTIFITVVEKYSKQHSRTYDLKKSDVF